MNSLLTADIFLFLSLTSGCIDSMRRFAAPMFMAAQSRAFFGKGWDNASLDTVYCALLRRTDVNDRLRTEYARVLDPRDCDIVRRVHGIAKANNSNFRIFLPPHLGDPHRLLKAYSLTAYPILDDSGEQRGGTPRRGLPAESLQKRFG